MFRNAIAGARQAGRDERGGVAIMFGVSIAAVCMMVGFAFDIGRTYSARSKIAEAADAAALAAAKGIRLEGLTDAEAIALAKQVFTENLRHGSGNWTDVHDVTVTIDRATSTAKIDVDASVRTTFAAISGIGKLASVGAAEAKFEARDIEIGLQLDLTGSMCSPCKKIDDLKSATKLLIDVLLHGAPTSQKVRIGLAPFAAGVNVGPYLRAVDGDRSSSTNCVYERNNPANETTDLAPVGTNYFRIREDLTPPRGRAVQGCPDAEIVPLTGNKKLLNDTVDRFSAQGSTAGQLGAAWAWNLVSPKWKHVWPTASEPVAYHTPNTDKIVVLMTDGVYNTIGGVNYGDTSAQASTASAISVDICTNMKDAGITIYTVGFDLESIGNASARTRATDTLKACAGRKGDPNSAEFFFKADDGEALNAAFNNIAANIMRLRLTN